MKKKEVIDKLEEWIAEFLDCISTFSSYEIENKLKIISHHYEKKNEWDLSWPETLMECHDHVEKIVWQMDTYVNQLKEKKNERKH